MKTVVTKTDAVFAADVIKRGGLSAVPTETVYGLAANGLDENAVGKLYDVKGRPETKPISLLVTGMEQAESLCRDIPEDAYTLARAFFPGPLTMILKKRPCVPDIVTASGDTVGIRCPAQSLTLDIIRLAGVPLAAPSANISGQPSPKTAEAVLSYFDGKIECVVDGGKCSVGVESTIVDMTRKPYRILRAGGLSAAEIAAKTGIKTIRSGSGKMAVIGITGGTGSGKTTALNVLRDMGARVIDCDALYHELLVSSSEMLSAIERRFPGVTENGILDRKRLGAVVFSDEKALSDLNAITHPFVEREVLTDMERERAAGRKIYAIDAIALLEGGLIGFCDLTVGITAPADVRVKRLIARDGITEEYARLRISAQHGDEYYKERCTATLDSSSEIQVFENNCREFFKSVTEDKK